MDIPFFTHYSPAIRARAEKNLDTLIDIALEEDGADLTSEGIFSPDHISKAVILTKEESFIVGLPLIKPILEKCLFEKNYTLDFHLEEGTRVEKGTIFCTITAPTAVLLKAERVILNFISHLSGVANLTFKYTEEIKGTGVILLDTRKTLPGMRYLEKYAVSCANAKNHRLALDDMLMLKDNHIDAVGSIPNAVKLLREKYLDCPPIEVECRTYEEVQIAVAAMPERIMLDNMSHAEIERSLITIPESIEVEISGNVSLESIATLARLSPQRKPDFISVGKITHSAPTADFSLRYVF